MCIGGEYEHVAALFLAHSQSVGGSVKWTKQIVVAVDEG